MISDDLLRIIDQNQTGLATLEGNLLSASKGTDTKSIFVTSCRAGEGKTTTAFSLAHGLATNAGRSVVLVDASLKKPRLHSAFGLSETALGLTDLLAGDVSQEKALYSSDIPGLMIMPIGTGIPAGNGAVLPDRKCCEIVAQLTQEFDYVIFDGDSVFNSSNAALLSRCFSGVILTVECERTKWEVVRLAHEKIAAVGGNVMGVVLNKRVFHIPSGLYAKV